VLTLSQYSLSDSPFILGIPSKSVDKDTVLFRFDGNGDLLGCFIFIVISLMDAKILCREMNTTPDTKKGKAGKSGERFILTRAKNWSIGTITEITTNNHPMYSSIALPIII
jgi:hypothetical protein